jgi:hypothetical protein
MAKISKVCDLRNTLIAISSIYLLDLLEYKFSDLHDYLFFFMVKCALQSLVLNWLGNLNLLGV